MEFYLVSKWLRIKIKHGRSKKIIRKSKRIKHNENHLKNLNNIITIDLLILFNITNMYIILINTNFTNNI